MSRDLHSAERALLVFITIVHRLLPSERSPNTDEPTNEGSARRKPVFASKPGNVQIATARTCHSFLENERQNDPPRFVLRKIWLHRDGVVDDREVRNDAIESSPNGRNTSIAARPKR